MTPRSECRTATLVCCWGIEHLKGSSTVSVNVLDSLAVTLIVIRAVDERKSWTKFLRSSRWTAERHLENLSHPVLSSLSAQSSLSFSLSTSSSLPLNFSPFILQSLNINPHKRCSDRSHRCLQVYGRNYFQHHIHSSGLFKSPRCKF